MKIASNAFANARPSPWTSLFGDPPVIPADLRRVARAFVDLQEERHEADYNLSKTLVKSRK